MAVRIQRHLPPRPQPLHVLANTTIDGLLTPVAYGSAAVPGAPDEACYMVCLAPPGPSVAARLRPWPEAELLEYVLRPVAHVLEHLQMRGLTHRGIRLDNVFQTRPGQPVVLGTAWAAPPATAQPALFEPPYSAMCLQAGRGDGSIADDVYCSRRAAAVSRAGPVGRGSARSMTLCSAASWSRAPMPHWPGTSGCRRSSATWCAACWPRTRNIGRRRHCCSIRPVPAGAGWRQGRHGGRSGPSRWPAAEIWDARIAGIRDGGRAGARAACAAGRHGGGSGCAAGSAMRC